MNHFDPGAARKNALTRLFSPRSLAVFGGKAAAELIGQARKLGFAGHIWPVHPRHGEVAGVKAFSRISDLPEVPDAAFIGVNRHASIDVAEELAALGVGGAVAYASGYAEQGEEGRGLQAALVQASGGMRLLGPNCYGFINYFDRAMVWPDQFGGGQVARGVAIVTQSGNIGLNITMQRRGLPLGYLITLGNQADIAHADAIEAVLDDPRVTAIGLHMEGVGDLVAFAAAVARAHALKIPVVALKTGRSAAAAEIALSHTGSMASGDAVVEAFFRRIGVARVGSVAALLETLKLVHVHGALPGRSISSLSCSGGEAALMADTALAHGLSFAPLSAPVRAELEESLDPLVHVSNPLDYHTFGWGDREKLARTFAAMMRAGADLNVLILDYPRDDQCSDAAWQPAALALEDAARQTGARAALVASLPENVPEARADALLAAGVAPLLGIAEAVEAIEAAAACGAAAAGGMLVSGAPAQAVAVSEARGKALLSAFGVPVPGGGTVETGAGAGALAAELGFPVAVKACGASLLHKTEAGAVRLNLACAEAVEQAAQALLPMTGSVLVERMVQGAVAELIVGVARDPVLGLYMLLGSGGVLAELVADSCVVLLPASREEIEVAVSGLRVSRLLRGFRGAPEADVEAMLSAILGIQEFVCAHADEVQELDVNPLMVCAKGKGAVAADVLLRVAPSVAHG
jgi:acyl-CoA synthetase (NDP forming)